MHKVKEMSKKGIRARMRLLRDSQPPEQISAKSHQIHTKLWQLIDEEQFDAIMYYVAFGSEVRTQESIAVALERGKIVLVPLCCTDGSRELTPCRLLDYAAELEENRFGILEPKPEFCRPFAPEDIDLVLVPALAYDETGYRVGYGAGYYDRFLTKCSNALFVGLAYEIQIIESTFPSEWDIPVHKVITECRIISCTDQGKE